MSNYDYDLTIKWVCCATAAPQSEDLVRCYHSAGQTNKRTTNKER